NPAAGAPPAGAASIGQNGCWALWKKVKGALNTWIAWSFRLNSTHLEILFARLRPALWSRCKAHSSISVPILNGTSMNTGVPGNSMVTIHVEDRSYKADPKQNLLHACLSLGFNLPYFCWHPAMGSVGACRQCAVKHFKGEKDTRGNLVMACMTPASDGTRISIKDPEAVAFRAGIIEGMMISHPHDCPVCDEGGHCHLQDMTVMTGHDYRR